MFDFLKDNATLRNRNIALEEENQKLVDERRTLKQSITDLEISKREQVAKLELDRKTAEEDIKHMQKMQLEVKDLEIEKEKVKLERAQQEAIANVKDEYRDKTEKQLQKQADDLKQMYAAILERLPNISARLNMKD